MKIKSNSSAARKTDVLIVCENPSASKGILVINTPLGRVDLIQPRLSTDVGVWRNKGC